MAAPLLRNRVRGSSHHLYRIVDGIRDRQVDAATRSDGQAVTLTDNRLLVSNDLSLDVPPENSDQAIRQVYGTPAVSIAQQALRNQARRCIPGTSRDGLTDPPQ